MTIFKVRVGTMIQEEGVPQGTVLIVTFFCISDQSISTMRL